jgi:hypothetical protein
MEARTRQAAHGAGSQAEEVSATILITASDEVESLHETIRILMAENAPAVHQILLVVGKVTTPASLDACEEALRAYPSLVTVKHQTLPYLGGAIRDGFEEVTGTHVIMMASDLETDPHTVKDLIARAKEGYDVVTASRWAQSGTFHGYNPAKYVLNWVFQKLIGTLYGASLTDLTFGFRIFRTELVKSIVWEEVRHPFLLETILKPLRLGARVAEVPTTWYARPEGASHNPFWRNFLYFRIALKVRFMKRQRIRRTE